MTTSSKKTIWIQFDLGFSGDYSSLFAWFDSQKAKECGDNCAVIKKEFKTENIVNELREELSSIVIFGKNDRLYLIYKDDLSGLVKGKFLFGNRKRAKWEGFAIDENESEEDM